MHDSHSVHGQNQPELPSEEMEQEFELWDTEYTVETLTDLTTSQIDSRRWRFENRVQRLLAEHNPGRLVEEDPYLARSAGKPAYNAQQWEQARKMILREAEKVRSRFHRAEGIVEKEEKKSKRKWYLKLGDALLPDAIKLG